VFVCLLESRGYIYAISKGCVLYFFSFGSNISQNSFSGVDSHTDLYLLSKSFTKFYIEYFECFLLLDSRQTTAIGIFLHSVKSSPKCHDAISFIFIDVSIVFMNISRHDSEIFFQEIYQFFWLKFFTKACKSFYI